MTFIWIKEERGMGKTRMRRLNLAHVTSVNEFYANEAEFPKDLGPWWWVGMDRDGFVFKGNYGDIDKIFR